MNHLNSFCFSGRNENKIICFWDFVTFNNLLQLPTGHLNDLTVDFWQLLRRKHVFCELVMIMPESFTPYTKGHLSLKNFSLLLSLGFHKFVFFSFFLPNDRGLIVQEVKKYPFRGNIMRQIVLKEPKK